MEHRIETGQKLIAEQRCRVERQRQFVWDLEATAHCENVVRDARELLRQMTENMRLMLEHFHRIEAASAEGQESVSFFSTEHECDASHDGHRAV